MNLCQLVLVVSFVVPAAPNDTTASALPASLEPDEQVLKAANFPVTAPALLDFFKKRIPSTENDAAVAPLIKQLTDKDPTGYGKASTDLIALGPAAVKSLRIVANNIQDLEAKARAKKCLDQIDGPPGAALVRSAARLLAALKPEGAAAALIEYYPFADDESVTKELDQALARVALRDGKLEPALLQALKDQTASRRSAAAVALCQAGGSAVHEHIRPLLKDPKPTVRFQIAMALTSAHDAEAVPILIDLLPELPVPQRKQAEEFLTDVAGDWAVKVPQGNDATSAKLRHDLWLAWWKSLDGKQLLEEFHSRTLSDEERDMVLGLIKKLEGDSAPDRDKATKDLIGMGPKAVPLLRQAALQTEGRASALAAKCVEQIEKGSPNPLPQPAARLLALRRPAGALETLLAYVPFAENEAATVEITDLIFAIGIREGKADPALVKALKDKVPVRRAAAAATALCRSELAEYLPAVRQLLKDDNLEVRLRTAQALAAIRERDAMPVLIALLAELPLQQGYEVEEFLGQLATPENAPKAPLNNDPASRAKCRDAWAAWWKDNGAKVDLAKLEPGQRSLGLTLVVEDYDPKTRAGRVVELDPAGKIRWKIEGLQGPVDAQLLPGQHVLIAEQNVNRVSERDMTGKIVWEKTGLPQPFVAQRQRNGNTFIATRNTLYEFDKDGKEVFAFPHINEYFLAATKFRDGQMAYVNNQGQYVRLDAKGKEIKSYHVPFNPQWGINNAEILPNDHVIISQAGNNLSEFSPDGKKVWEATIAHAGTPYRLPNGQTLVPNANALRIALLDREGKVVSEMKDLPVRPWRVSRR